MTAHTFARHFGEGPRDALALHCMLGHSGNWRWIARHLGDRLTITSIDLPGHGSSADWNSDRDLHDQCADAARGFLQEEPIDLLGHSFGATVALRLAMEHPQAVRSLTLVEPVYFAATRKHASDQLDAHLKEAAPYRDALAAGDIAMATRLFNRFWGDGSKWDSFPESAQRYMIERMHLVPAQAPSIFDDGPGLLRQDRLERVTTPTLLIEGTESPGIVSAINAALAARLPNVRRVPIAGSRHMVPLTHPEDMARAVVQLLEVT